MVTWLCPYLRTHLLISSRWSEAFCVPLLSWKNFPSPFCAVGVDALQTALSTVVTEVRFLAYPWRQYICHRKETSDIFALAPSWFRKLGSPSWVKKKLMGRRGGIKWTLYLPYRVGRGRCTYFGFFTRGSFRQIKLLSKEFTEFWAVCGWIHSYFIFGEVNWGVAAKGVNHSHF